MRQPKSMTSTFWKSPQIVEATVKGQEMHLLAHNTNDIKLGLSYP